MIKLLFLGSETYPTPIFRKLLKSKQIQVVGLVTAFSANEDLIEEDIFKEAKAEGVLTYQPKDINLEAKEILRETNPDIILVCNYGQFLGEYILNFPEYRCLNIHFSLLPVLRGACPIEMAILQGLSKTGITIQLMEKKLDTGDILFQEEVLISKNDTGGSLAERLQGISAEKIEKVMADWVSGRIKPKKQDDSNATYCIRDDISKEKAKIDWGNEGIVIERKVRAFNPRSVAWTELETSGGFKRVKVFKSSFKNTTISRKVGQTEVRDGQLLVQTGSGVILPEVVQLEGKKKMTVREFLQGYRAKIGFV
ncbi:methionyl-tRNA formyltransferase [Candidatus Dojkabacteria bacterium]|nr:methionyl-tRNA formyltransferase [Candidatus Dojkabacteria bacterium]